MFEYMIINLIFAWFLSLFGFNDIFCNGMYELFGVHITNNGYYLIFALVGLGYDLVTRIIGRIKDKSVGM